VVPYLSPEEYQVRTSFFPTFRPASKFVSRIVLIFNGLCAGTVPSVGLENGSNLVSPAPQTTCAQLVTYGPIDETNYEIHWDQVKSDEEAVSCLSFLANSLGRKSTKDWLEKQGFKVTDIKQMRVGEMLLSATWSIKEKGILYNPGFKSVVQVWLFAYSNNFAILWRSSGDIRVTQGYVFE
jgi:hypothetical protein